VAVGGEDQDIENDEARDALLPVKIGRHASDVWPRRRAALRGRRCAR
jgi:hypothetical protein